MAAAGFAAVSLGGCKIITVEEGAAAVVTFDPQGYADGLWTSQALPHFEANAKPLPEVLAAIASDLDAAGEKYGYRAATEGSPWSFIVAVDGTVSEKNTESRAGTLVVAVDGAPAGTEVTVQIGPVVRGNAVRDALPFVSFKDFTNQLEFADVGKAMTALAVAGVAEPVAAVGAGQKVAVTGVMNLNSKSDKIVITPVLMKVTP